MKTPFVRFAQTQLAKFVKEVSDVPTKDEYDKSYQSALNKVWKILEGDAAAGLETAINDRFSPTDLKYDDRSLQYIFTIVASEREVFELNLPNLGKPLHQVRAMAIQMAKNGLANTPDFIKQHVKNLKYGVLFQSSGKKYVVYGYDGLITEKQLLQNQQAEYTIYTAKYFDITSKTIELNYIKYKVIDTDLLKFVP